MAIHQRFAWGGKSAREGGGRRNCARFLASRWPNVFGDTFFIAWSAADRIGA